MDKAKAQEQVAATGRQLLEMGLVARTWGNISCRIDSTQCAITPSGLDYKKMKAEDIATLNIESGNWQGNYKPSGEKGVHMAAYSHFTDVGFVIHTHQNYATAIGISGFDSLDITDDETKALGGIALATYGLPGTKKLTGAVADRLKEGNHTVLMAHHGALVCGKDKEEALSRVQLLEKICARNLKNSGEDGTDAVLKTAEIGRPVYAQLDDMAQMIGRKIPVAGNRREADKLLKKHNVIIVKGEGVIAEADNEDDKEALVMLAQKACICHMHTLDAGMNTRLGIFDVMLMNLVYKTKYSKQKNGEK